MKIVILFFIFLNSLMADVSVTYDDFCYKNHSSDCEIHSAIVVLLTPVSKIPYYPCSCGFSDTISANEFNRNHSGVSFNPFSLFYSALDGLLESLIYWLSLVLVIIIVGLIIYIARKD